MAPLTRRTNLTLQGNIAIIVLVILFVAGIFCAWIFYKILSKQRRNKAAMQRMQEERTPFVSDQYVPPQGAPSAQIQQPYIYDGPLELHDQVRGPQELQGAGRPITQEVDGYAAAVSDREQERGGEGERY
jgi:hypothetical protein